MTEITIYTNGGAINYQLIETTANFKKDLIAALEAGSVTVDTIDGASLIINPLTAAAIEIRSIKEQAPPGSGK